MDPELTAPNRFGRLIERRDDRDFPYYNGEPMTVATWKWLLIIVACVLGFLVLILVPSSDEITGLIPRILFPAIPLTLFIVFTGKHWSAIFRRLTGRDWLTMVVFWLLNLAVTSLVGILVAALFGANANTAADGLADAGGAEILAFFVGTGIQLFGEEIFTLLPFLAVMYLFYSKAKLSRKTSIILAWLITAVWFGAAHLPTYGWNVAQALLVIGTARLVLTLAFIRTKNIAVSTGAHILNDWSTFGFVILTSAAMTAA
ncbi:CPBP family intramembrane metalloprotease [Leucobacter viscericola]|uniref:CPBP family intramembrane metalloprotease n=1 Tax=Leucobacter viscericola TaxID=2714935 RepID=A0A6G7XBX9_9MICO|nr:CPBP family intramembrane glutamic endopeptidase [Leucobacter viscericola]QIK61881.1 CPBP family intramembrane metalloprotease [Leucobacter viscericola]